MKRVEPEHILRASKEITGESHFIVIGSQAILGSFPDAPRLLRQSMEVDMYPRDRPELATEIEGSLGRYSLFDQSFGYYADGVSPETAVLPDGWEGRLVSVLNANTAGAVGWCLDPHDLAFSKLAAAREKDLEFVAGLARFKLIRTSRLKRLVETVDSPGRRNKLISALQAAEVRANAT